MDLLVLGGTSFVGRTLVERALARGHAVTLFSRGRTAPELFPQAARLRGDRSTGDYTALHGARFDAVVDVSAYVPRHVQQAADALAGRAGRALLVSTGSVYDRARAPAEGLEESSPRLAPERRTEEVTSDTYGPLKVACEDDLADRWGSRATVVRPGIVAGPHDPTDRFTYWVRRAARGGRVAVPGRLDAPAQVVDARDLAALMVALVEDDRPGTYNAVGPAEPVTLGGLVLTCAAAAGSSVEPAPVPYDPELPLGLPDAGWEPMFRRSAAAARAVGLPATPLATTAADVLAWDRARGEPPLSTGVTPAREAELLG